jgi:hypothetical protein
MTETDGQEIPVALYDRLSTKARLRRTTLAKDTCTSSGST